MSRDTIRQFVTVIAFSVTVAINGAANALPINGQTTGEISDRFEVFVIPAGYVFSIWGLIYLGLLAFTVYQALPARRADPVLRSLGWLPALTGILNTTWLVLWQYEIFVATVPVMVALLVTLITIHRRLWGRRDELRGAAIPAVRWTFSVYLGWITVATIANVAQTLAALGVDGGGLPPEGIAAAVLVVGLAIAVTFVRRFADAAYGLVIVWAYAGIVVKEIDVAVVALTAGAGALVVAALVAGAITGRLTPTAASR
jgi:hypothetical protein